MARSARTAALGWLAVAAVALAGCTADPEPAPTSARTAASGPSTSASASETASSPDPTESPSGSRSTDVPLEGFALDDVTSAGFPDLGGPLGTTGSVRVGRRDGHVRVVWEFPGEGAPNHRVRYVDVPLGDGSGDPVDVEGDAWIEVLVSRLDIPDGVDDCPVEAPGSMLAGTVVEQALAFCGGFEGVGQAFVGLDERRPFRVTVLTAPTRLVVDVATG